MVYSMFRFLRSQILQELSWLQVTEKKNIKIEKEKNLKIYLRKLTYVITVGWPVHTRNALTKWKKNIKHSGSAVKQKMLGREGGLTYHIGNEKYLKKLYLLIPF